MKRFLFSINSLFLILIIIWREVKRTLRPIDDQLTSEKIPWREFDCEKYIFGSPDRRPNLVPKDPYLNHNFNQNISDSLPADRDIQDLRSKECKNLFPGRQFHYENIKVSIIITFYNEAKSTLLRSIVSILKKTPKNYLKEIILVDDFSDDVNIGLGLADLEYVRLFRNDKREGLIRSRIFGAERTSSSILIFLDSHIECNKNWLPPLLSILSQKIHSKTIVSPIIDTIHYDNFKIIKSSIYQTGGFNWDFNFKWDKIRLKSKLGEFIKDNPSENIKTAAISGGIFAVRRHWFFESGGYDERMELWGGENIEISIRNWLCGGRVLIAPCSRVAHVFRKENLIPYLRPDSDDEIILKNKKRVVKVWAESFENIFYKYEPKARNQEFLGNSFPVSMSHFRFR